MLTLLNYLLHALCRRRCDLIFCLIRKAICFLALAFVALAMALAPPPPPPFHWDEHQNLTLVHTKKSRCNDGSLAGFYYRKASPPSKHWLLVFQGGAYCFDNVSCVSRWNSPGDNQMSSKSWTQVMRSRGIMQIREANVVFIIYCSSDDHLGNNTAPMTIDWAGKPVNYFFEGGLIVREVLSMLQAPNYGLNQADLLILSGTSTGGVTVHAWADRIQGMFPKAHVSVLSDSGFFLDPVSFHQGSCVDADSCPEIEGFTRGVMVWKPAGNMDEDCEKALGPGNPRCILGPHVMPFITSRWLTYEYQFDVAQLRHYGIYTTPTNGTAAYKYAMAQGANLTNILRSLEKTKQGGKLSFISPSCYKHGVAPVDNLWLKFTMNGAKETIASIFGRWLLDAYTDKMTISLVDSCRDVNCNPSCLLVN